ncbi:hypothetical protein AB0877_07140 [Micromonospora sp. NPDC047644]|uniref:hypothetical protein n=1 Tax=Micromonospora sp. NPDC047644 TaxID=3157203 RepID=UPI0034522E5B
MALRDAILTLTEHWPDVERRLSTEQGRALVRAMRSLAQEPDDEDLMFEVVTLLVPVLPRQHPVFEAILIEDVRSTATPRVWARTIERLREIAAESRW